MPTPVNMSDYAAVGTTGPSGGTAPDVPVPQAPAMKPVDASEYQPLPNYANGATPLTPVNQSPIPLLDRVKLSMGNTPGKINYLKQNFDDAMMNKDGDLVVKDQGIWHRVDAKNMGETDPWEASKKILNTITALNPAAKLLYKKMGIGDAGTLTAQNLHELAGSIAGSAGGALDAAGGVLGGMAGAGVGSVATAGAGGAGAEAIRTSLGRLAGTYEATPEEQVKDMAWEGLLNSGAQTVAIGAKPTLEMMGKALQPYAESATNFVKEHLADFWGNTTGSGRWAVRRAMDDPQAVIPKAQAAIEALPRGTSPLEAAGVLKDNQKQIVDSMASEAQPALSRQYREGMKDVLANVGDDFTAKPSSIMQGVQQKMEDAGYGTFSGGKFKLFSPEQLESAGLGPAGVQPRILGANTRQALQEAVDMTNQYAKIADMKGPEGAKRLLDLRKAMDESFSDLLSGTDVPDTVKRVVTGIRNDVADGVGQTFANHSDKAYQALQSMNEKYAASKDAVDMLTKAARNGTTESLVPQLTAKAGSNRTLKDEALTVANLLGPSGHSRLQALSDMEAAKGFLDFVPKPGGSSFDKIAKLAGKVTQQGNPRAVAQQIAYGSKALDFLQSMGKENVRSFLSNDAAVKAFTSTLSQGIGGEAPAIDGLLNQAGVK